MGSRQGPGSSRKQLTMKSGMCWRIWPVNSDMHKMQFSMRGILFLLIAFVVAAVEGENMNPSIFETAFKALESNMEGEKIMVKDEIPEVFLQTIDTDGNKIISMDELKKLAKDGLDAIFKLMDENMDGILISSEIHSGNMNYAGFAKFKNILFGILDTNKDGYISTADATKYLDEEKKGMLKQLDINEDGRITMKEFRKKITKEMVPIPDETIKVYKLLDRNEDGQLSMDEISKFLKANFNMIDNNNNGVINGEEIIKTLEKHGMKEKLTSMMRMKYKEAMKVLQNKNITNYVLSKLDGNQDMKVTKEEFVAALDQPAPTQEEAELLEYSFKMGEEAMEDDIGGGKAMAYSSPTVANASAENPSPDEMMKVFKSALNDLEQNIVSLEASSSGVLSSSWILMATLGVITLVLQI